MNALTWLAGRAATDAPYLALANAPRDAEPARPARRDDLADAKRLLERGEHEAALLAFDAVLRAGRDVDGIAHLGRALCLLNLGREDDAAGALQDAGDAVGLAEVPLRLARVCALSGNASDALRLVGVALAAEPGLAPRVAADPKLVTLRDHPAFLQMVGQL
jgi:tetratricopeptide (TPR) repeat protein